MQEKGGPFVDRLPRVSERLQGYISGCSGSKKTVPGCLSALHGVAWGSEASSHYLNSNV